MLLFGLIWPYLVILGIFRFQKGEGVGNSNYFIKLAFLGQFLPNKRIVKLLPLH